MTDLKPWPECGGEDICEQYDAECLVCENCGFNGPNVHIYEAKKRLWNKLCDERKTECK